MYSTVCLLVSLLVESTAHTTNTLLIVCRHTRTQRHKGDSTYYHRSQVKEEEEEEEGRRRLTAYRPHYQY